MNDLELATAAAHAGAVVLLRWFQQIPEPEMKGATDPVTAADREAEAVIVELIGTHRPTDGILAEESGETSGGSGRRWVIDPLDGTVNFVNGIPVAAVSVAVEDNRGVVAAAVFDPFRSECFAATRGGGATLNGDPIAVSGTAELGDSVISTGFAYDSHQHGDAYAEVMKAVLVRARGIRRSGSAALDLAWVACGRYEGHWEFGLSPWDMTGGALLVAEAGGRITDSHGDRVRPGDVVATNGQIHPELLGIVATHRPRHLKR